MPLWIAMMIMGIGLAGAVLLFGTQIGELLNAIIAPIRERLGRV